MTNSETFSKELGYIADSELRLFVGKVLDDLPDYFSTVPASTSGKYHPSYALGKGGLVRHTKAAVGIARELLRAEIFNINNSSYDIIYAALILHDGLKCGFGEDHTVFLHPFLMSAFVDDATLKFGYFNKCAICTIRKCIESHMGKWNTNSEIAVTLPTPETALEKLVHLSDYLASRKVLEYNFDAE